MQTPSVGRVVHALVDPATNNGADIAPAVITRVWGGESVGRWTVNYRVLLDAEDTPWITSAQLHADEDAARAANPNGAQGFAAYWPPRV